MTKPNSTPLALTAKDKKRFWSKVDKQKGGCWLWTACKTQHGYGVFELRDRTLVASRVAWEMVNGAIPHNLCVLHNCPGGDNPSCVNPAHLYLGTDADNGRDRSLKGQAATGKRNGQHTHPERRARGDRHGSRTHPEAIQRGGTHWIARLGRERLFKVPAEVVVRIKTLREQGLSLRAIGRECGYSHDTVKKVLER